MTAPNAPQATLPLGVPKAFPAELRWLLALPAWAQDQAQTRYAARLSVLVRTEPCLKCGQLILHALDDQYDGATDARADPLLITPQLELVALLANRKTYTLITGPAPRLRHRTHWAITHAAPTPIVPEHRCNDTTGYPIPWEAIYTPPPKEHTECPF